MTLKEIKELIDTLTEKDVAEFEMERGNERIRIRRHSPTGPPQIAFASVSPALSAHPVATPPATPSQAPALEAPPAPIEEEFHLIKSPIVGTYYAAPSPGA